jgi:F1F0 ATPase subunit 2
MRDSAALILALLAGFVCGAIFFAGLWWTIRRGLGRSAPAAWFLGSFVLRTGIAVTAFYFVYGGDWRRLLACTLGFLAARSVVLRRNRVPRDGGAGLPRSES